ncbi:TetR/AcrR family transcriptional regulator [Microlunatus spumicola]|uniref:TetR/AcrR family transcriptional regulator n=1 Tax=Microlunatus spumicola TaxID=81499 RepID=A0ABP6WQE9_9ACTN
MTPEPTAPTSAPSTLVERKRQVVRQRIIEAADELFAARGFSDVSVTDIAARADVGRSTFFRYFGDKTEVVFAKEQAVLDAIAAAEGDSTVGAARTSTEAVEQLRPLVLDLCEQAAGDRDAYRRHDALLEQHLELRARDALKTQQIAGRLSDVLRARGTEETLAVFAAQIALACYQSARQRASTAGSLTRAAQDAFREALELGRG